MTRRATSIGVALVVVTLLLGSSPFGILVSGWAQPEPSASGGALLYLHQGEIWRLDVATGQPSLFLRVPAGTVRHLAHSPDRTRLALWIPTNIRQSPQEGFGNGTSRLRVYTRGFEMLDAVERLRNVRTQIDTGRRIGEWALPPDSLLYRFSGAIQRLALWFFSRRPRIDLASAVFSHSSRFFFPGSDLGEVVDHVHVIGPLGAGHPLGIYGVTLGHQTFLTCVYDPAMVGEADIRALLEDFQQRLTRFER